MTRETSRLYHYFVRVRVDGRRFSEAHQLFRSDVERPDTGNTTSLFQFSRLTQTKPHTFIALHGFGLVTKSYTRSSHIPLDRLPPSHVLNNTAIAIAILEGCGHTRSGHWCCPCCSAACSMTRRRLEGTSRCPRTPNIRTRFTILIGKYRLSCRESIERGWGLVA